MTTPIRVQITPLPHYEGLDLPAYSSQHAAGLDLRAAVPETAPVVLPPGGRALIPTGLTMAIPHGYEGQVRPRSGLALKHGVTCLNTPGTVDSDYRGEVGVILVNLGEAAFVVRRGERIAQMVFATHAHAAWEVVETLGATERGHGGFGSTGHG